MIKPYIHRVLYRECDMMGVMNNAVYVNLTEDARVDALSQIGCAYKSMEERGFAGPVLRLAVEYKASAKFGDDLEILVSFARYTGVRLYLSYEFRRQGTDRILATATSEHCFIELASGAPVMIKNFFPAWDDALRRAAE